MLFKNNEVLQNEVHINEYGVEEKVKENDVMIDKSSQDKMTFDTMNSYQKRCRICVDKTMEKFTMTLNLMKCYKMKFI